MKLFEAVLAVGDAVTWRLPTAVRVAAVWAGSWGAVRAVAALVGRCARPQHKGAETTIPDAKALSDQSTEDPGQRRP